MSARAVKDESIPTCLLFKTLISSAETAERLGLPTVSLYYSRYLEADSMSLVEGPSSMNLIRGLTYEVQMFLSTITGLMYILLCLACLVQAFYVMRERARANEIGFIRYLTALELNTPSGWGV